MSLQTKPNVTSTFGGSQISLGGGYAFPALLPDISEVAARAARDYREEALQYGPLMGLRDLREDIVGLVAEDGVTVSPDNVLVLNGAKQGLDLALRVFTERGDLVVVSKPNYATALHIFRNHQVSFLEIEIDQDGMRTVDLEEALVSRRRDNLPMPKLLYVVPDFHNPAGVTLGVSRRQHLVELAQTFEFMIVEDDPYRRVKFTGNSYPSIQSFDKNARVIGLGTVSKVFAPGIRVGWAVASVEIVARMAKHKSDGGSSPFTQRVVSILLREGKILRHTEEVCRELKKHRDAMVTCLRRHLPQVRFTVPDGGYYLWIKLPQEIDCDVFTAEAAKEGIAIFSGRNYFANDQRHDYIRLCFSNSTIEQIEQGIGTLGRVAARLSTSAPAASEVSVLQQHYD